MTATVTPEGNPLAALITILIIFLVALGFAYAAAGISGLLTTLIAEALILAIVGLRVLINMSAALS